jgi:cytochrome c-type biogenesis protein CcmH
MIRTFILVAGTLAAATALLLLIPLTKRRTDEKPAAALSAGIVTFVLLLGTAALYSVFSNYGWQSSGEAAETPAAMAAKLAGQLAAKPDDLNGWLMLGRSYAVLEQYPLAVRAYQRADRLADGKNGEALLGLAENLVAQDPEAVRGAAGRLFERALALEPGNAKALFYSAFAAMSRGETDTARERFKRMLALNPPDNIRVIIEQRIAALDMAAGAQPSGAPAAPAGDATVSVHVTVAPNLRYRHTAEAALFVLARDPQQPGPPFAARRLPLEFPVDVTLSATDAMLPSRRIAAGQTLEVVARIALAGTALAGHGDPFGQVSYHVGKDGRLNIVIGQTTP